MPGHRPVRSRTHPPADLPVVRPLSSYTPAQQRLLRALFEAAQHEVSVHPTPARGIRARR
jgi:hypothetical protein